MSSSDWSLVFFTFIGQFSVGVALTLLMITFLKFKFNTNPWHKISKIALFVATVSIGVALLISFLHLSAPLSSIFALSNLKSSWLSREILMVSVYGATILATTAYWIWQKGNGKLFGIFLSISTIFGIMMVFTMGKLYMLPTVPAWNTPITLISFYVNTVILGTSFMLLIAEYHLKNETPVKLEKVLLFLIIIACGIKLATNAISWGAQPNDSIGFYNKQVPSLLRALSWFWVLGLGLLIRKIFPQPHDKPVGIRIYAIAFVFFVIAEFAARVIFYWSYFRVGV
ncbi:MAG: DmsC/YnfH family molybdoenzyme membrane anchor subunit [Perlabentimonas sp.]